MCLQLVERIFRLWKVWPYTGENRGPTMRLIISVLLLISFSAYGQRVRENIKQKEALEEGKKIIKKRPIKSSVK